MKNKKVVKKTNKKILKFGIFSGIALLGGVTAAVAAACGSSNISNQIFTFNNYTDVLQNNNSPLNPTFTYQPISTYAQSAMISLLTYETSGGFKFDQNGNAIETTKTTLKLEAATKVEGLDSNGKPNGFCITRTPEGIDETDPKSINFQSQSFGYRFTIDRNIKWVDKDGVIKDSLSGKDFERGLETYKLSSDLGYNRNGYFISLTGLDFNKTVGYTYKDSSGKDAWADVDSPDYDINNYQSTDDTFTLYLKSPYPYIFSILTKDYFNPLPHNNKYVQNIRVTDSNTPLAIDTDSKGNKFLNQQNTNWNEIYGSGQVGTFLNNSWFAGAYYFNKFSRNQIVGILNDSYMDSVGPSLDPENGKKIKTFLMNYGSGNPEVDYENFAAGQISYLSAVPNAKRAEAISRFLDKGLYVSSVVKISQSKYIAYTPKPYVFDSNGNVSINNPPNANTISPDAAQMIYNWNSKPSIIIRTGLSGLINHYQLSKLNISSGDFQYSNVPYGSLDLSGLTTNSKLSQYGDYYKAIDNDALYGGLPRQASDYYKGTSDINSVFTGAYSSFSVPYYSYVYDANKPDAKPKVEENPLDVNKVSFIESLQKFGATASNPFVLQYKYGEGSISDNYDNYLKALKRAIEALGTDNSGNKLLVFNLVNRQAPNPSVNDWYSNQRSSLGFSYWSPDYNGVGTWLEANGTLDDNGLSSTNNHNIFNSLLRVLIMSAIDQNVSSIQLTDPAAGPNPSAVVSTTTPSVFDNDLRIQAAFGSQEPGVENKGGSEYAKLGVEFLQYLVDNKVLNPEAVNQLITDPTILENEGTKQPPPKTESDLYPLLLNNNSKTGKLKNKYGKDISIFNYSGSKPNGSAEEFSKYLGIWAGLSSQNALWATLTMDNDYELLPLSEGSLREKIYSLVNPHFFVRSSSVGSPTIRDYEQL